ncbi:uncharacterized protein LOC117793629 [Drosophila innubila]|uniref:uncharacterized protein LOC117793629 n=1 Tax=Drosophila innubila TaxID=198719 RepID=UPI00148E6813|nr:uncharacterized protein LOC117793629 [Drosophila innubila]
MRTCLILLIFVAGALSLCSLSPRDPFPMVAKRIGSKTAILKGSSTPTLRLSLNETVIFYCPQGLEISRVENTNYYNGYYNSNNNYNDNKKKINGPTANLKCGKDGIYSDGTRIQESITGSYIKCSTAASQVLYESTKSLSGCDADAMTLIVGYKLPGLSDVKQLAMCYDLGASRLRFVKFMAYPPQNILLDMSKTDQVLNELNLDKVIDSLPDYFHYTSDSEFQQLISDQKQFGELYDSKLFEYSSLLQDQQQLKDLDDYKYLLKIVWLRSLRQGNWKHWLEALRVANDDNDEKFELRIGVSGVATLPLAQRCNVSRSLQLEDGKGNSLTVPAYIWAHVRSLQPEGNAADEFVLVAHNSPYVNVLELGTLCDDICSEIPWLSNSLFGGLHLLPMYGVVHCCRMDAVDKLTEFPFDKQQQQPMLSEEVLTTISTTTNDVDFPKFDFDNY